jgi:hypothetical protein
MNLKGSRTPNRKYTRKEAILSRPGTQKAAKRKHGHFEKFQTTPYGGFKNTALKNLQKEAPDSGTQIFTNQNSYKFPEKYESIRKLFEKTL